MPWLETSPMTERQRFVADARRGLFSMTELCARYSISRKTGYKWCDRYEAQGRAGLVERSRAPEHCPHKISEAVVRAICEARRAHPSWGPGSCWAGWPGVSRHCGCRRRARQGIC
jgi:putative transposase